MPGLFQKVIMVIMALATFVFMFMFIRLFPNKRYLPRWMNHLCFFVAFTFSKLSYSTYTISISSLYKNSSETTDQYQAPFAKKLTIAAFINFWLSSVSIIYDCKYPKHLWPFCSTIYVKNKAYTRRIYLLSANIDMTIDVRPIDSLH